MAASIKKKFSLKGNKISDGGSTVQESVVTLRFRRSQEDRHQEMPPDKEIEEKALQACFKHLSKNLPPDDVAMEMNSRELLTPTEHDKYLSMKQAHTSDITKSEYLLQCLGRRKAGFLTRLSEILREIKQASYLVDDIIKAYKTASQQVSTSRLYARDRLSKLSNSDPDLYAKGIQECTRCKILEQQNRMLERQCRQLKEQQELHQITFQPIKCLSEVAENQLHRAQLEGNKLKELLPSLQTAVTTTASDITAVQVSLQKLNELLSRDRDWSIPADHKARDSMISEGSIHECTSEAHSRVKTHNDRNTTSSKTDSRQSQSINRQNSETRQAITYTTEMRRTKSDSAGTRNRLRVHRVESDKPIHPDIHDPQLQQALQRRRERVETTASSQ